MEFPALYVLDQKFKTETNADAELSVAGEVERTNLLGPVVAGQKVVITAGSRGVDSMATVLHSLVGAIKARGAKPVILPAMVYLDEQLFGLVLATGHGQQGGRQGGK